VNCRSNHLHLVVSAGNARPRKVRSDLKEWASRCLKRQSRLPAAAPHGDAEREKWWAERGSIRFLYDESSLEAAILYVTEGQDVPRPGFGSSRTLHSPR
jgi:hypothetical protein